MAALNLDEERRQARNYTKRQEIVEKNLGLEPVVDAWTLIEAGWYRRFVEYHAKLVSLESDEAVTADVAALHPGPIDNSSLLAAGNGALSKEAAPWSHELAVNMKAEDAYFAPFQLARFLFDKWFGGGPAIKVWATRAADGAVTMQDHVQLQLRRDGAANGAEVYVPSDMPYCKLRPVCVEALGLEDSERLVFAEVAEADFLDLDGACEGKGGDQKTHAQLGLMGDTCIFITRERLAAETRRTAATPQPMLAHSHTAASLRPTTSHTFGSSPALLGTSGKLKNGGDFHTKDQAHEDASVDAGLAGLQNLGNTCFMNSALQCLTHCMPVVRAFLSGAYRADINEDNPLGKGGEVALAFGSLVAKLWRGGVASVAPRAFRTVFGRHSELCQGYEQHDSQEFMAKLLDMLHEDINRVKQKRYVEEEDDSGQPDAAMAERAWRDHLARNDSAIVDHFQGQLKTARDCPQCGYHNRKFDPFMYVTAPIPGADLAVREFTHVCVGGTERPMRAAVRVHKHGSAGAVASAAAEVVGLAGADVARDLVLALWSDRTGSLTVLDDHKATVPQNKFPPPRLVLYSYARAELGPGGGGARFVVHPPSAATQQHLLPLVVHVPHGGEVRLERCEPESGPPNQYAAAHGSRLADAVVAAVRPYQVPGAPSMLDMAATAAAPSGGAECGDAAAGAGVARGGACSEEEDARPDEQPLFGDSGGWEEVQPAAPPHDAPSRPASAASGDMRGVVSQDAPQCAGGDLGASAHSAASAAPVPQCAPAAGGAGDAEGDVFEECAEPVVSGALESEDRATIELPSPPATASDAEGPAAPERPARVYPFRLLAMAEHSGGVSHFSPPSEPRRFRLEFDVASDAESLFDRDALAQPAEHASLQIRHEPRTHTLQGCLEAFMASEVLGPEDLWFCPKCREGVQARTRLDLWALPEVLVIHLKRFVHSGMRHCSKIDDDVAIPLEGLDMAPFMRGGGGGGDDAPQLYDCVAFSCHMGTFSGGHYTAYARNPPPHAAPRDGDAAGAPACASDPTRHRWFCFNDSHVSPVDTATVDTRSAYLLFYRRRKEACQDPPDLVARCLAERRERQVGASTRPASSSRAASETSVPGLLGPESDVPMDTAADVTPPSSPRWAPIEASHIQTPEWCAGAAAGLSPLTSAVPWEQARDAPPQSPVAGVGGGMDVGQWVETSAAAAAAAGALAPPATPDGRDAAGHVAPGPLTGDGGPPSVGSGAAKGSSSGGLASLADSGRGGASAAGGRGGFACANDYVVVGNDVEMDFVRSVKSDSGSDDMAPPPTSAAARPIGSRPLGTPSMGGEFGSYKDDAMQTS